MYILWMYYISLLLLPPDGFVLCYIGLHVLTLWRFDDDVISPSPGMGRYRSTQQSLSKYHVAIYAHACKRSTWRRPTLTEPRRRWSGRSSHRHRTPRGH